MQGLMPSDSIDHAILPSAHHFAFAGACSSTDPKRAYFQSSSRPHAATATLSFPTRPVSRLLEDRLEDNEPWRLHGAQHPGIKDKLDRRAKIHVAGVP
jgi:hypothetical protein